MDDLQGHSAEAELEAIAISSEAIIAAVAKEQGDARGGEESIEATSSFMEATLHAPPSPVATASSTTSPSFVFAGCVFGV